MAAKKKSNPATLTWEQKKKILLTPCKTRAELQAWTRYFLNLDLPDQTVSRHATTNPLSVVWEIYDICVNQNNPEKVQELLYVASRGSGKTLGAAIAEFMIMLHDRRDIAHVGAIMAQAGRAYDYIQGFCVAPNVKEIINPAGRPDGEKILQKSTMEKSVFEINGEKCSMEILPTTIKALNGVHASLISCDELDTLSGEGLKAIKEVSGMLDTKKGKKPLRVNISTRKSRAGLMNQMMEGAIRKDGSRVRHVRCWTALEFTERCPDERSGTIPTDYWINVDKGEVLSLEEYDKLETSKKKDFFLDQGMLDKCKQCPVAVYCRGDAKKQQSKSNMLKTIDELNQKILGEGHEWAASQLFNLKPSSEGLIFREFEEQTHVKTWNEMWQILTGKEFPGQCTHDLFVKKCFSADTEVLTNNGFKFFQDLTPYDTIASLDDTGKLIYEQPTDYISYHYKGKAYNLFNKIGGHGKQLDLLVTQDHNQVYLDNNLRKNGEINFHKKKVQNLPKGDYYIPAAPFRLEDKPGLPSPISFMTDDQFYAFLGAWLSEGSMSSVKAHKEWGQNFVEISQYKSLEYVNKIRDLMNSIDWPNKLHFKKDSRQLYGGSWGIYNKELYDYLRPMKFAVNKRIPRLILEQANHHQLSILLEWLMWGDGSNYDKNREQQPYYGTGSTQLANDVQELAFRLGYRTNLTTKYDRPKQHHVVTGTEYLPMYRVQVHSKNTSLTKKCWYINGGTNLSKFSQKRSHNLEKQHYDGMVYCVTMPSGRLFVRRNGVIALSGNCHEMGLPAYSGVDWGWSNPHTVVYLFVDKNENVFVVRCDGMTYISQPMWIHQIKTKYQNKYRCQLYAPDLADKGSVLEMQKAGLPVANDVQKPEINASIQTVKKFLRVPGLPQPKIFLAKETCQPLIDEFSMYHYKLNAAGILTDDPDDANNHWIDALRYIMFLLFGKSTIVLGGGLAFSDMEGLRDPSGNYNRMPTPMEYAVTQGITVNQEPPDMTKLGKIGTARELEREAEANEDDPVQGSGGFLWSF